MIKPAQMGDVLQYQILDEVVLYRPGAAQALSLNESARVIWELCEGKRTVEEICIALGDLLAVPPERLRDDVWGGVNRLFELGLLCEQPAP